MNSIRARSFVEKAGRDCRPLSARLSVTIYERDPRMEETVALRVLSVVLRVLYAAPFQCVHQASARFPTLEVVLPYPAPVSSGFVVPQSKAYRRRRKLCALGKQLGAVNRRGMTTKTPFRISTLTQNSRLICFPSPYGDDRQKSS